MQAGFLFDPHKFTNHENVHHNPPINWKTGSFGQAWTASMYHIALCVKLPGALFFLCSFHNIVAETALKNQ